MLSIIYYVTCLNSFILDSLFCKTAGYKASVHPDQTDTCAFWSFEGTQTTKELLNTKTVSYHLPSGILESNLHSSLCLFPSALVLCPC